MPTPDLDATAPDALDLVVRTLEPDVLHATRWRSSASGRSDIWRLQLDGACVWLKGHRSARKFRQERRAYEEWVSGLPTPRLLAAHAPDGGHSGWLVLTHVPGTSLARLGASCSDERLQQVHTAAGRWLRRLHSIPLGDADEMSVRDAIERRLEAALERAAPYLSGETLADAGRCARSHIDAFDGMHRVPCHRDFTPHNWLVEPTAADTSLHVIDFEHARPDVWLQDLARLAETVWSHRPDLRAAFMHGYGRSLTSDERAAFTAVSIVHALTTIQWAAEHGDCDRSEAGRVALRRHLASSGESRRQV